MKITLNGSLWVNDEEYFFDNIDVEVDKMLDLPFDDYDCDIDKYIEDCEDCGFCDFDCEGCDIDDEDEEGEFREFHNDLDDLLEIYTDIITESHICPECITEILLDFLSDVLDIGSR